MSLKRTLKETDIFTLGELDPSKNSPRETIEKIKENIFLKQPAAKELGYNYEIWVYNAKGEKVNCYQ